MADKLGRGPLDSLAARARAELGELARRNRVLRRSRYPLAQRALRAALVGRSLTALLILYGVVDLIAVAAEWLIWERAPAWTPGWTRTNYHDFLINIGSYLIAAQVGMLGIVAVAVGIVSLLSQGGDASTSRTDVRLYYVEAMAYEVVTSGVALLIVLALQLFWPLQYGLHLLGWGGADQVFKVTLTGVHLLWLTLNLVLFFQFITTTLSFVEPRARERLRERYSANVIIPRDLARRLLGHLYPQSPAALFGEAADDPLPRVSFGLGLLDAPTVEISTTFSRPSRLTDVWLAPVGLALRSWRARSQAKAPARDAWRNQLAVKIAFDSELEGPRRWVQREGGVPLTNWERWLLRLGFRFSPVDARNRDLPTPDEFIEALADKLVGQIANGSLTGFKAAMAELTRYHRFLLDTQATHDDKGRPFNLALIGGFWQRPDQGWIQLYRRVLDAAAEKMGREPHFMDRLSHLTQALLPTDPTTTAPAEITTLLDLGKLEVVVLEQWFTRHSITEVGAAGAPATRERIPLAGSDARAFESVLRNFVGAWETVQQLGLIAYRYRDQKQAPPAEAWGSLASSWPFLQAHLHACAYFFAFAVWNQDELGAERYRDLLLRWLSPFSEQLQDLYLIQRQSVLNPTLMAGDWSAVERLGRLASRFPTLNRLTPGGTFGVILKGAFEDLVVVSAAVALTWHMSEAQAADLAGRAADRLLRKAPLPGEGSTRPTPGETTSIYQRVLATIVRSALGSGDGRYGAHLDGLVMTLQTLSASAMVPGRHYFGWGADDVDSLAPALLAMLVAHVPATGDDGFGEWLTWLIASDGVLADRKTELDSLAHTLGAFERALGEVDADTLARGVAALNPNADLVAGSARVGELLADAIRLIETEHLVRLRATPVDPVKLRRTAAAVGEALLRDGPSTVFLRDFVLETAPAEADPLQAEVFTEFDKGAWVTPALSVLDYDAYDAVEMGRTLAANHVIAAFNARPRETVVIAGGAAAFWREMIERSKSVLQPMLLVPEGELADSLLGGPFGRGGELPDEFTVEHLPEMQGGGGGAGYVGTLEAVHVFQCRLGPGRAILYSGACLQRVSFAPLRGVGEIAEVEFVEMENPQKSGLRIKIAMTLQWSDDLMTWLEIPEMAPVAEAVDL